MRIMSCGCYKWHSGPPSAFDINRDIKTPRIIEQYCEDSRAERQDSSLRGELVR